MTAVHFTTIPFEPNTASYTRKVIFFFGGGGAKFVPVLATLHIVGLKFIKLFCVFFMSNFMVFMR